MLVAENILEFILELSGVAGFIFYMLAYGLLQMGKISGQGYCYTCMNMAAAILVLLSLVHQFNLASVLIQLSWIVISLVGLYRLSTGTRSRKRRRRRSNRYAYG